MRSLDRLIALVLGLALAAAGVLAGIEAVLLALGNAPLVVPRAMWDRSLRALTWDNTTLTVVAAALVAAGVLLLLIQLIPRRPVRLMLGPSAPGVTWIARQSLADRISYDVQQLDDVTRSSVRLHRRTAQVAAGIAAGVPREDARRMVTAAATTVTEQVPLAKPLKIKVKVSVPPPPKEDSSSSAMVEPSPRPEGEGAAR